MMKYVLMIVLAAIAGGQQQPGRHDGGRGRRGRDPRRQSGEPPLAKTWTTGGQENEAGSQVLAVAVTYEPWLFSSGGQGIRTLNRLPGT